jgi:L-threonylcarbamoyladenylate synthase
VTSATGNPFSNLGLDRATETLKNGNLVAFPTDTFFALGADALNPEAVERVFQAKGRNPGTPVPVLVGDAEMAGQLVREFPDALRDLADQFWPGALTVVLPASDVVPRVVSAGTGNVGLRVPDHQLARELIALANTPLTGTSCNISGQPPTKDADIVRQQFGAKIAMCIDAPCGSNTLPSTVVGLSGDSRNGKITLLRAGAIDIESIRKIVGVIVVD